MWWGEEEYRRVTVSVCDGHEKKKKKVTRRARVCVPRALQVTKSADAQGTCLLQRRFKKPAMTRRAKRASLMYPGEPYPSPPLRTRLNSR